MPKTGAKKIITLRGKMSKKIYLCAINNTLSGNCSEDCAFCTQSAHFDANINRYRFKPIEQIIKEAKEAKKRGAIGYCLVTSGKGLDNKKSEYIAKVASTLKKQINNLNLIACCGTATKEQLQHLKRSGIDSYNHNLESSKDYYAKICSTHSWEERYQTCLNVKEANLKLCCGGIYGMGESWEDRVSLIEAIASLKPQSTPINFFIPNPSLPIKSRNIEYSDALEVIKKVVSKVPKARVMVAGGREVIFDSKNKEMQIYSLGVSSIVIGNYLTVDGKKPELDIDRLKSFGLDIAKSCHE
jgi:biotin synthase